MNQIILNEEQEIAVKTESRKVLCVASAGAGKTRVLIERIAHLIEEKNVSPYEIASFSFTRKAGQEITERLVKRLGSQAHKITTGTMHSVALKFLQRFGELIGLCPEKITVYNKWESDFLLKDVAKDLGYHNGHKWVKVKVKDVVKVMDDFNSCFIDKMLMDEFESEDPFIMDKYDCDYGECVDIVQAFNARCKENNALTYDSILYHFYHLLPEIKQYLGFRHIFVDETQDNSPLQWDITNKMTELCDASLFVLGDVNQSIYSFRGADPEYLVRNQGLFDVLKLRKNYRSDANIVEAANKLISHNKNTIKLEMQAVKDSLFPICHEKRQDSQGILAYITGLYSKEQQKYIAVLARNHFMLEKLSKLLDESGIKHEYIGKQTKLAHSEDFRRFNAFFNLILNPNDNFSFLLIKDILGINRDEYADIRISSATTGKSHYKTWQKTCNDVNQDWLAWFMSSEKGDMDTVIDWLKFIPFGFDIDQMLEFVYLWRLENYDKGIDDYLNWLAVYDIQDEIKKDSEELQLMTIHASKGLEFETVIIAGLNETILPSKQAMQKNEIEEERRLCYVAVTRAKEQLILTSRPFEKDLFEIKNQVSRFVKEMEI